MMIITGNSFVAGGHAQFFDRLEKGMQNED